MFGLAIWGGLTFGSVIGEGDVRARRLRSGLGASRRSRRSPACSSRGSCPRRRRRRSPSTRSSRPPSSARRSRRAAAPARIRVRPLDPARGAASRRGARAREHRLRHDGRLRRPAARRARHRPRGRRLHRLLGVGRRLAARARAAPRHPRAPGAPRSAPGLVQGLGLIAVGAAQSLPAALAAAALMGAGMSLLFPSLALLVVDRVDPARRGRGDGRVHGVLRPRRRARRAVRRPRRVARRASTRPRSTSAGRCCLAGALLGWFSTRGIRQGPVPA